MRVSLFGVVLVLVIGCSAAAVAPPPAPAPAKKKIEPPWQPVVRPPGYVEVLPYDALVTMGGGAVLLIDEANNRMLPIFVGGTERHVIELRLRGASFVRPLTHDLLDAAVKKLRGTIVKVQIDELRPNADGEGGTFHGSVYIRSGRRVLRLDARPSDAIALAIGNRIPIYCAETVLAEAGMSKDELLKQLAPAP